jgi:hypothetical protein
MEAWTAGGAAVESSKVMTFGGVITNMNGSYFRFLTLLDLRHDDALTDSA